MEAFLLNMEKNQMDIRQKATSSRLLNKYVSIFRIDGEPILPPLMTSEKRKQMQKYREKAMRLEKRFKERLSLRRDSDALDDQMSETSHSSTNNPCTISEQRQELNDVRNIEEPLLILQNILKRHNQDASCKLESDLTPIEASNSEDMKDNLVKLQTPETLMFDNLNIDTVENDDSKDQNINISDAQRWLLELERTANLNYVQPKKFSHFYLTKNKAKGIPIIPTISINSPTIGLSPRSRHTSSSETESNESLIISDTRRNMIRYKNISSDESFNNLVENTHSQAKRESLRKLKNTLDIASKIQKFESINNDNSSITSSKIQSATTPTHSSPEKDPQDYKRQKPLDTYVGNMSRSATSPSLKQTSPQLLATPQTSPEREPLQDESTNLVRSTSFILEGPSKALIEHMRQQNSIQNKSLNASNNATASTSMSKPFSARITKDTIESKAKKVQKAEFKSSRTKIQQKPSSTKISGAASAAYNSFSGSNISKPKHKKSPYDTGNQSGKQHGTSSSSKLSNVHSRKSLSLNSSTTTFKVAKGPNAASLSSKLSATIHSDPATSQKHQFAQKFSSNSQNDILATMDEKHKAEFLKLLAQQDEEKRKLQESFEQQQKLLYAKLTNELPQTHTMNSPRAKGNHSSSNQLYSECHTNQPRPVALTAKESLMSISGNSLPIHNSLYPNNNYRNNDLGLVEYDSNCNIAAYKSNTSGTSPRRRLYLQENTFVKEGQHQTHVSRSISKLRSNRDGNHKSGSSSNERRSTVVIGNEDNEKYYWAGTVINSYARGYLTRRLLRTEEIQRIIRTIRDTLIFVINLHLETCEDPIEANDPANIKLKARLLQQLSSASYRLHTICFDISIKERMDIIQRDRRCIQTKLLALNRNNRRPSMP